MRIYRFIFSFLILSALAMAEKLPADTPALPLVFEFNAGQAAPQVKFLARQYGMNVFLWRTAPYSRLRIRASV